MMTAGIAPAESFRGNDGPNTIRVTDEPDRIEDLAGDDNLFGRGGQGAVRRWPLSAGRLSVCGKN